MIITHKINVYLDDDRNCACIDAVQCDVNTRMLQLTLYSEGKAWNVPDEVEASVAYRKQDGTSGWYDKMPNGTAACTLSGNIVTALLAEQVLTAPGKVMVSVVLQSSTGPGRVAAFPIRVDVAPCPGANGEKSNNYYNYQTFDQLNTALVHMEQTCFELDAELTDMRTDFEGREWPSAGEAMRELPTTYMVALREDGSLSRTFAELKTAHEHAKTLLCYWEDLMHYLPLTYYEREELFVFSAVIRGYEYTVYVDKNDSVSWGEKEIAPGTQKDLAPLTINGQRYDGSEAVEITVEDVFEVALSQEKDGTFVQFPTSDEIDSAYKAGKQIRLRYRGRILPLVRFYGVYGTADWGFVFSAIEDNTRHLVTLSSGGIKTLEDTVALQKNIPEPFYVTVSEEAQGEWVADRSYEELLAAKEAGRELQCLCYPNSVSTGAVPGATALLLPLVMHEADDGFTFGGVSDLGAWSVYIGADMTIWGGFVEFGGSGRTPHIGSNGNWWIGEEDTGVKAAGEDGRSVYSVELDASQSDESKSVYSMTDDGDRTIGSFTVHHGKDGADGPQGPQGEKGDTGAQGPKGADGADGYAPVRGTDYWTDGDKAEMVKEVATVCVAKNQGSANVGKILVVGADGNLTLTDMPEGGDVIGTLDESNNILLTGALADGTYTLKYTNKDGTYTEIGTLEVGVVEAEPANLFAVGGDGFILNGRCSSTGADRTDTNGCIVSNYIEVANGDTVYIKNATVVTADVTSSGYSGMKLTDGSTIGFFPNNTSHLTGYAVANGVTQFTINHASAAYIRVCLAVSYGTATTNEAVESKGIIITVNEPLS